ncbi:MAG: glycosyltransferase family 2 protein [Oscillochloridaceae bacterium]|nr:glycosyltransferase [Chloroflexaceae bacterium]MDW8388740.1 glycosyltransferase family 2 protein [Oscillochloridaceae bacterium]
MELLPLALTAPAWAAYAPLQPLPPPRMRDPARPLVSIVTPSLNQGRFLEATLRSVLEQDYPNLEYWVIDGGSQDETLAILRAFAGDSRLHWLSEPDHGQSDAINKGWARSRGEVLAWINADDTYFPGAIAAQVAALLADPRAGAVYGDACYTDAAGRPLARLAGRPFSPEAVLRLEIPVQPTVFLRRDLVARVGPLRLERRFSMDSDYWARAIRYAPFRRTSHLTATYRLHPESKTVAQGRGFYDEWLAIAEEYFANVPPALRVSRPAVLADIYAAMANLEAGSARLASATRYATYAWTLAGPRPRLLKLPLVLLDRALGLRLAMRATALWGRLSLR